MGGAESDEFYKRLVKDSEMPQEVTGETAARLRSRRSSASFVAILEIETAAVFEPLLHPSRYKGAHGGRGSGKSHFASPRCWLKTRCVILACAPFYIREVQKSLKESAKRLIEDKIDALALLHCSRSRQRDQNARRWRDRV